MTKASIVVVGCGIGGLAAAVAALEQGGDVTIVERAPREERGGQTRYTEAYLRMKSESEVTDDFETHLAENGSGFVDPELVALTGGPPDTWPQVVRGLSLTDPDFISTFAEQAGPTIAWLKRFGLRFDFLPTQFLTKAQPRLLPVGGGLALVEGLAAEAERRGAKFLYETTAQDLARDGDGRVTGLQIRDAARKTRVLPARSVILACGGFEGNAEMMTRYVGPRAVYLRPICRGGYYNRGEGVRMALAAGAAGNGDFGSYHAEPVDPRSGASEPSVFIFPYGILVNQEGQRFVDEAPGPVDAHYESVTRRIFEQRGGIAHVILDAKHRAIPNYQAAIRTDKPPIVADGIADLARLIGIDAGALTNTVDQYNAATRAGKYDPLHVDGVATEGLAPRKSNWALPIDTAPFTAYPIISANVFTFGGLKVDSTARVIDGDGRPIEGLYAAGEIIGTYYHTYTGATSVLKGAVFGRIAGRHATTEAA